MDNLYLAAIKIRAGVDNITAIYNFLIDKHELRYLAYR